MNQTPLPVGTEAIYIHNNGDKEPITVIDYEKKSDRYWVKWDDGFVNLMPSDKVIPKNDE